MLLFGFNFLYAHTQTYYGKIDNHYSITMKLTFHDDKSINGYYFYNKWKKKIKLAGKYTKDTFVLNAKDETFTGTFSKTKILGTWKHLSSKMDFYGYAQKHDPFEDKKLTCDELKAFPEKIFGNIYGIDLGSGHWSPLEVDYNCEGGLGTLEFTKILDSLADQIRYEQFNYCSGSIAHAHWRYYRFDLLNAGLAPDIYIKHFLQDENAPSFELHKFENVKNYFSVWGHASLYNYELYNRFWDEYDKAFPLLKKHFEKRFSVSKETAKKYAEFTLRAFVLWASGSFPSMDQGAKTGLTSLEKLIIDQNTTLAMLEEKLSQSIAQEELNKGLKVAILYNRDTNFIENLLKKGAIIDSGDESALFFALKNKKMIQFLLEQGADVNYRNSFGKTVLYYAIELDDIELVKILLENGANINNTYIDAKTKNEIAWSDKFPFYQSLCSLKHTKRTPLMHAAQHASVDMLQFLISQGAKKDAVDEIGYNILDYAYMEKKEKNIAYLKSIGLSTKRTYWD